MLFYAGVQLGVSLLSDEQRLRMIEKRMLRKIVEC
jgi:hypothetical protein